VVSALSPQNKYEPLSGSKRHRDRYLEIDEEEIETENEGFESEDQHILQSPPKNKKRKISDKPKSGFFGIFSQILEPARLVVEHILSPNKKKKRRKRLQTPKSVDIPLVIQHNSQIQNQYPIPEGTPYPNIHRLMNDYPSPAHSSMNGFATSPTSPSTPLSSSKSETKMNLTQGMAKVSLLDDLESKEQDRIYERYKNQHLVRKGSKKEIVFDERTQLLTPPSSTTNTPSSSRRNIEVVDYEYEYAFQKETLRVETDIKVQEMKIASIKSNLDSAPTTPLSRHSYPSSPFSKFKVPSTPSMKGTPKAPIDLTDESNAIERYDLASILKPSPMSEFRRRIQLEEDTKLLELIQEKREKLRKLAEEYSRRRDKEFEEVMKKGKPKFPPMSSEEEEMVEDALDGDTDDVISEGFNVELKRGDILTLENGVWLNDEVINFYFNLIMERNKKNQQKYANCFIFSTFFYPLLQQGFVRVKKWTRKFNVDIFNLDKVIVPIHIVNHWTLGVINFVEKRFEYYDSLGGDNTSCLRTLRQYIVDEYKDKKGGSYDVSDWTFYQPKDIPLQENGYDCGVFMCKYADYISKNSSFTFEQEDIRYFRKRMILDIVRKEYSL